MSRKNRTLRVQSLRCKFKTLDSVEITVVDETTGEQFIHLWQFRKSAASENETEQSKEE